MELGYLQYDAFSRGVKAWQWGMAAKRKAGEAEVAEVAKAMGHRGSRDGVSSQ